MNSEDILKLAEKQDKLKASRHDLMQIITSRGNLHSPARDRSTILLPSPKKRGTLSQIIYTPGTGSRDIAPKHIKELSSGDHNLQAEEEEEARRQSPEPVQEESSKVDNLYCCHSEFSDEAEENDEGIGSPELFSHHLKSSSKGKKVQVFTFQQPMRGLSKSRTNELGGSNVQKVPEIKFVNPFRSKTAQPGRLKKLILPTMEGFLKKKSTNLLKVWQRRYFVLRDKKLYYYPNESKDLMSGCVDFDLISIKLEKGKDEKHLKYSKSCLEIVIHT